MSFYKNGNITIPEITNGDINPYDKTIYFEPDNSGWIRIVHHNNPSSAKFASTDSFKTSIYRSADVWFNASVLNSNTSGKWELMIKQKLTSSATETKYRFIQTVNPMTATYDQTVHANVTINTQSGYSTNTNYGGIYYKNSNSYLVTNNAASSNWYGALGCWSTYNNGIPGIFQTTITTGYLDLYYRIDDSLVKTYMTKILGIQSDKILANDFMEY